MKLSHDTMRDVLGKLVLSPRMKAAARDLGLHPTTLFQWINKSKAGHAEMRLSWMGVERWFHEHVDIARKLSTVALDHSARDLAINGHSAPKFLNGQPVWTVDPKIAADALSMDDEMWEIAYGDRKREDIYVRDANGALVQEMDISPPNPQLLVKMLASLVPDIYGERSSVTHIHQGHVWIEGSTPTAPHLQRLKPEQIEDGDFQEAFAMADAPETVKRPANVLAIPAPCKDAYDFDRKFLRKLVREPVLFRDADGRLEPPLSDDVIVEGSEQAKAYADAGIEVRTVTAQSLLDQGYTNDFLYALAGERPADAVPEVDAEGAANPLREEQMADDGRMAFKDSDTPLQRDAKEKYWANRKRVAEEQASGKPPVAPPPVPKFAASPDDHMADTDTERASPPVPDKVAIARQVQNYIDEATAAYASGRANAPQRQVAQAVERGEDMATLTRRVMGIISPSRRHADHVGAGEVSPGGMKPHGGRPY